MNASLPSHAPSSETLSRYSDAALMCGLVISAFGMCISVPIVYCGYALAAVGTLLQPRRLAPFMVGWPWAVAFSIWTTACGFWSPYEVSRVPPGWAYCWPALPFWALAASQPRRLGLAMWSLLGGAVVATSLAMVQFLVGYRNDSQPWRVDSSGVRRVKASGFYSHWIRFGDALAFASLWLIGWLSRMPQRHARYLTGLLALIALGVVATFISSARGAFLAFIIGGWILAAGLLTWRRLSLVTIAIIVILGLVGLVAWPTHGERIQDALAGKDGRTYIWHTAWETFCLHPFTGVGFRGYDQAALATVARGLSDAGPEGANMGNAHNSFLSLMVLYGIPGLFLWCAWLASVVLHLWRHRQHHPAVWPLALASLGVFLIGSLTEDLAAYASSRFQLFFGLALALGCARGSGPSLNNSMNQAMSARS
jgi:O-antigen ligase